MSRVLARLAATAGLTVAAVGAVTALPATSVAPALGAAHCAAADTPAHVAFVVDFGGAPGAPGGVTQACVSVPSSDTGTEALAELSRLEGWPAPTYADSGLLCSIDGFPKTCQTHGAPPEAYWSYWFGTSRWTFANAGPASQSGSALTGQAQGWRFQPAGQGNGSDPAPRGPSDPATICAAGILSAPAPASPGPSHSVAPAVHPGAGQRAGSAPSPAATTSTVAAGARAAVTTPGAAGPTTIPSPTTAATAAQAVGAAPATTGRGERRVAARPIRSVSSSGGSALPVLITVVALAALGASGGYYRRRRRHAPGEQ